MAFKLNLFAVFEADPIVRRAVDAPVLHAADGLSAADLDRFTFGDGALD